MGRGRPFLAIITGLLLAGCAAAPAPVATPTPLGRVYTAPDGQLSFQYPSGWVVAGEPTQLQLANSPQALTATQPRPGQFQARITAGPIAARPGLTADATPRQVVESFVTAIRQGLDAPTFSEPVELTIGAWAASRVEAASADGQAVLLAVDLGDGIYAIVSGVAAPGELAAFELALRSVIETLVYTLPEAAG